MSFFCPRDENQLNRFDHTSNGKWFCSRCSGAFVFEKRLRKLEMGPEFLRDLSSRTESKSDLSCPACNRAMVAVFIELPERTELERCHDCELIWFDRDEFKSLSSVSAARSALQFNPIRGAEDQTQDVHLAYGKALLEINDFGGLKRWDHYSKVIRIGNVFLILVAVAAAFSTYRFESEYRPAVLVGRTQSSSPLGYALSALVFSVLSSFRPRRMWPFSLFALLSLYQALMTWFARS